MTRDGAQGAWSAFGLSSLTVRGEGCRSVADLRLK
jgi:hypothetical protein